MVDLDELERLHAGLPVLRAESWFHEDGEGYAAIIAVVESDYDDNDDHCDDDDHPGAYDAAVAGVRLINALPGLIAELRSAREALTKISAIRDSIIGTQSVKWSEHIYPLVAALKAAGYEGAGHAIASANLGTLLQRIAVVEAERDALREVARVAQDRCDNAVRDWAPELRAALAKVPK